MQKDFEARVRRRLGAIACVPLLLSASTALAQPPREASASETVMARDLFREAGRLRDQGDWSGAAKKLHKVVEIKETAGVRLHLAHALARTGQLTAALRSIERAQALNQSAARPATLDEAIAQERADIEARIPTLAVRCADACDIKAIIIDGTPVARLSEPARVDPGRHRVEVVVAGRSTFATEVTAQERARLEIIATWPEASASATASPASSSTRDSAPAPESAPSNTKTYVMVGEGAFALTGLVLGLVFRSAANDAEDEAIRQRAALTSSCSNPIASEKQLCADLRDNVDRRAHKEGLATGSFIAAGVGIGAMVATQLLWPSAASRSSSGSVRFVAAASPQAIQVGVGGVLY